MIILLSILGVAIIFLILSGANSKTSTQDKQSPKQEKQQRAPLTDAEREAIRQADEAFDWQTHNAIANGSYTGQLPEYDGVYWTNLYPHIYHTKIAGINYCRGINNLAGKYFDAKLVAEPTNKFDPNAIKIVHAGDQRKLGYIPADETDDVRKFVNNDLSASCRVFIEEGEEYDENTDRDRTYLYGVINIHKPNVSPNNNQK